MRARITVTFVTLLLVLVPFPPARAQSVENSILFIVDSSGSMAARSGGKTKMDAAKQVMTELVNDLPQGVRAGLIAYGHRQKSDCKDVELMLPVRPVAKEAFAQKINSLQPLGQTPISDSIRQAAGVLKSASGR